MSLSVSWMARTRRPILVGPWTSEMGFEVLYWLPFLAHLTQRYGLAPERLIAVTRGGAGGWYGVPRTVELFDYVPPGDLRINALASSQAQGSINQWAGSRWERALVRLLAARLGLRRYHVLHPSVMFRALKTWWGPQTQGFAPMMAQLRFVAIPTPIVPVGLALPESYVVMRWYSRPTWPLRDDLLDWTHAMTRAIAQTTPVVIMRSSTYLDDHADMPTPTGDNITTVIAEPWRESLAIQSAVMQRAVAFIGTWGGLAQLAVRLGKPTAGFVHSWQGASYAHKMLTDWLAQQQGTSLFVGRPHDAEAVRAVLPQAIPLPELPRGSSS